MTTTDKIICLGTNYIAHAKESGSPIPDKPVIFLKPPSVLREIKANGDTLRLHFPSGCRSFHPECEVVFKLKRGGYGLTRSKAEKNIDAFTIGLDCTLRDVQQELKRNEHPWTISKVFPDSAIVGPWISFEHFPIYSKEPFYFIAGDQSQRGVCKDMRLSLPECTAYVSKYFNLCPGDIIFSGTPGRVHSISPKTVAKLSWGKISVSVQWS